MPLPIFTGYSGLPMFLAAALLSLTGCRPAQDPDRLFTQLDPRLTGISFNNTLENEPDFNILDYLYFYDGAGVALGDVNNDGLIDIFFTANQSSDRLYLNEGGLTFKDVTEAAGIDGSADSWSTGVTMADVDADGWLDIYVCQVNYRGKHGRNRLYMNNRDGTFTDKAETFGLDFEGLSTQAAFFDYDRDGDLDMYLLNHAVHSRESFAQSWRRTVDAPEGDRLYRNDTRQTGRFVNASNDAGIYSSVLGYGLGLAISDVNLDGWPDIYVGNDFHENDYLYLNNRNGTFTESLYRSIGHTSQSSMGNDVADFNNDGLVDIVSLDMLPADRAVFQRSGGPDSDELARIKRNFGYGPQVARNTLQLHRGFDDEGFPLFSEIGAYAGVHATDWSWAALFADLDNDGWKDLFVTNGIPRRPNDLDYIAYVSQQAVQQVLNAGTGDEQLAVTEKMPALSLPNYAFRNTGKTTFEDRSEAWGLAPAGFSNGAAYGDLDNDGDLDLVVNNIDAPAFVFRNNSERKDTNRFLTVELTGNAPNTTGIGAKVTLYAEGMRQIQEQMPTRGFQSSVSHVLHFGLGAAERIDSLTVFWPDGTYQRVRQPDINQRLVIDQADASQKDRPDRVRKAGLFRNSTDVLTLRFRHEEDDFFDDLAQPLLPHKLSMRGPALAVADVNGDGRDDVFLGGAHGQAGVLFLQHPNNVFEPQNEPFTTDRESEDVDAAFIDADGDRDLDLYVTSGGGRFPDGHPVLQDRLYINDGRGRFSRSSGRLPSIAADGCCVAPADFDSDGDIDLFVGSRAVPGSYGKTPESYLLENDGSGYFADVTPSRAPFLAGAGMITAAIWADVTGDERQDLVLAGEWMPITILRNDNGLLQTIQPIDSTDGWWQSLLADDFDADGDLDLIAGNLGVNSVMRASRNAPLRLFVDDFDNNGSIDPIIALPVKGQLFPWTRKDVLLRQAPALAKTIQSYTHYANATLGDLFSNDAISVAIRRRAFTFESVYLENDGTGRFERHPLPREAQWTPLTASLAGDFNADGHLDVLTAGNFFGGNTIQGPYDAGYGLLLTGDGKGAFSPHSVEESRFILHGAVRNMQRLRLEQGRSAVVVARNDAPPAVFVSVVPAQ